MAAEVIKGYGGSVTLFSGVNLTVISWTFRLGHNMIDIPAGFGEIYTETDHGDATVSGTLSFKIKANAATTIPFTVPTSPAGWRSTLQGTMTLYANNTTNYSAIADCTFPMTVALFDFDLERSNNSYFGGTCQWRMNSQTFTPAWDQA